MLSTIKVFIQEHFIISSENEMEGTESSKIQLAAAMLFVEVMYADHTTNAAEEKAVQTALKKCFALTSQEIETLISLAKEKAKDVTSLHEYTSIIHRGLSLDEKIKIVEQIWTIILADNEIDKHEEHLARKIADLLHLRRSEFIQAKLRVLGE
jgi:uncharacterized tellurite resistance protein B-like protein